MSMNVNITTLYGLVGKSFILLDGTIADIYLLFQAAPVPFFLVKRRGSGTFQQVDAVSLLSILQSSGANIYGNAV